MNRLPVIPYNNFSREQKLLFERITGGKRGEGRAPSDFLGPEGGMKGPFNAMMYGPGFGEAVQRLGEVIRFEGSIEARLREMAILIVGAKWKAEYEFQAHAAIAEKAGLSPTVIASIKEETLPEFEQPSEAVIYHFARELLDTYQVSDQPYQAAVELLGEAGVVELVYTLGFYTLISMSLNVFQV